MKNNLSRIKSVSRFIRIIFVVIIVIIPITISLYWIFYNNLPLPMKISAPNSSFIMEDLEPINRILCFAAGLIPIAVQIGILVTLARLFHLYEKGEILSARNVQCFKRLGQLIIARAIAGILYTPLISLALSITNPPGQRQLSLGLTSEIIGTFLVGTVILVVSWVMDEGRAINDEQKLVI
ncbi:MAG TPA: DUF2975 domain-containing protein [Spirochaetota bacterium]